MRLRNEEAPTSVGVAGHLLESVADVGDVNGVRDGVHDGGGGHVGRAEDGGPPIWKRVLDVTCIVLALPVLLPLMSGIALLIFCVSPGSVLFLQERVGYRGRRFICFKFRTMKPNSDVDMHRRHLDTLMQSDQPMVKMDAKGDPRLIPLGAALRSTGLDELPQLLNVLGGQMSLVGPRPCLPYEYDRYLPAQKRRFETLPGLTGLWQVSGKNNTTFSEMIAFDIQYAEANSLRADLSIMFKTVPALLAQVKETRARRRALKSGAATATPQPPVPSGAALAEPSNRLRDVADSAANDTANDTANLVGQG